RRTAPPLRTRQPAQHRRAGERVGPRPLRALEPPVRTQHPVVEPERRGTNVERRRSPRERQRERVAAMPGPRGLMRLALELPARIPGAPVDVEANVGAAGEPPLGRQADAREVEALHASLPAVAA